MSEKKMKSQKSSNSSKQQTVKKQKAKVQGSTITQEAKKQKNKAKPFYYKTKKSQNKNKSPQAPAKPVRIAFLGGLNEVGKNITLFEYEDDHL